MRCFVTIAAVLLFAASALAAAPPFFVLSRGDSVQIKLSVAVYRPGTAISYDIRHWPGNERLASGEAKPAEVSKDAHGRPTFAISELKPKLWSMQDPQLYTVTLTAGGSTIGTVRFGFRTFEIKDRRFHLNGRPVFLRSMPINPPGRDLPPATGANPSFARAYLRLVKNAGVNMVRTESEMWLDACDEVGLMVFQGRYGPPPGGTSDVPPPLEAARTAYRPIFEELASHPSVVIYVLTNEVTAANYGPFLDAVREDVRLLDPTRPVIGNAGFGKGQGGEVYDIHPYSGWYYGNLNDWYGLKDHIAAADAAGKPLTISECTAAYTCDSGEFLTMTKQLCTMLRWAGPVEDQKTAALDYQAELVRQIVETGRRLRTTAGGVAGIMPFTYFLGWASAKSASDLIMKPAFETLKLVFQPVLISADCWTRNLHAGDTLRMRLCVVNDDDSGRDLGPSGAAVDVVSSGGKAIASGEASFSAVPYYSNAWSDLAVAIPADTPRGDYTVRLRLLESGNEVSQNSFGITIAQRGWAKLPFARVTLYDPYGDTAASLKLLGVEATTVADLKQLPQNGVLVFGEKAFCKARPDRAGAKAFVERGGRILCLRQPDDCWKSDWLPASFAMKSRQRVTYLHPIGGNQALFRDLRPRDLRIWNEVSRSGNGAPSVEPVLSLLWPASHADLAHCRVWASAGQLLGGAALLEVFEGRGSVIVSQFRCVERAAHDPMAAELLSNLISYALSDDHQRSVDLSRPVKWDLAAFRSGVFCSPLQGLLPHSPTYLHRGSSKGRLGEDHRIDGFTLVGDYSFRPTGWIVPVPDPKQDGWGVFYGALSQPASAFRLKLRNPSAQPAAIRLRLDGADIGSPATLAPGEVREVEWITIRQPGPVQVELRGDQDLVITESRFE